MGLTAHLHIANSRKSALLSALKVIIDRADLGDVTPSQLQPNQLKRRLMFTSTSNLHHVPCLIGTLYHATSVLVSHTLIGPSHNAYPRRLLLGHMPQAGCPLIVRQLFWSRK